MNLEKDRELTHLFASATALLIGLIWMFFGIQVIDFLVPPANQNIFYYFISGVIFSLAFVGLYGFIQTILYFSEFVVSQDNLSAQLYENLLASEHEGVFLKDKAGVYKKISKIAQQVLKLENKTVIGFTDKDLSNCARRRKLFM